MKIPFLASALLLAATLPAAAELRTINRAGQTVDVHANLQPERPALVYFHLTSSALSRRICSELPGLSTRHPELDILVVELNQLTSPVARQYSIGSAPYVQEYDKRGDLKAGGVKAYDHLLQLVQH